MDAAESVNKSSWLVIVNPASADGLTGRRWPRTVDSLRRCLPPFDVVFTDGPGRAGELARRAMEEGYEVLAVHGGDGTINEVVNGIISHPEPNRPALALLPSGTGADLVRSLGIARSTAKAVIPAAMGRPRFIDLGLAEFIGLDGTPCRRFFVNVADIGFGGNLVRYVNSHSKRLGGQISFFIGLLATLFDYTNKRIRVTLDCKPNFEVTASSIVIANGQYFGGGMWVAPEARPDDGLLEVVVIGDVTRTEVLTNIPRLYRGTLAEYPKVQVFKSASIRLESDEGDVLIDMDGELVGRLPAMFSVAGEKIGVLV